MREAMMTFKLLARFESSEVQSLRSLSLKNLFSGANSEKHSLGNHERQRTSAKKKKSLYLHSALLKWFELVLQLHGPMGRWDKGMWDRFRSI